MTYIGFFALVAAIVFVPELLLLCQQIMNGTFEIKMSGIVLYALGAALFFLFVAHGSEIFPTPFWVKLLLLIPFALIASTRKKQFYKWVKSPACPSWYRWYFRLVRIVCFVFCLGVIILILASIR